MITIAICDFIHTTDNRTVSQKQNYVVEQLRDIYEDHWTACLTLRAGVDQNGKSVIEGVGVYLDVPETGDAFFWVDERCLTTEAERALINSL